MGFSPKPTIAYKTEGRLDIPSATANTQRAEAIWVKGGKTVTVLQDDVCVTLDQKQLMLLQAHASTIWDDIGPEHFPQQQGI